VEVWQTSNLRLLKIGEEKRKKKKETTTAKYNGLPYWAAIIIGMTPHQQQYILFITYFCSANTLNCYRKLTQTDYAESFVGIFCKK